MQIYRNQSTTKKPRAPLTKLQNLNLKRGSLMFYFGGLISGCLTWTIRNHVRSELQYRMLCIQSELKVIRDEALRDVDNEISNEKQRINDAVKEIMNEPDAGN